MAIPHIQAVPKQSTKAYKLLSAGGDLTAREIADKLGILPNTVYRAIKPLTELGMVEALNTYPVTYRANSTASAMDWYLRVAAQSFRKDFGNVSAKTNDDALPSITFIKDRKSLLTITEQEARKAIKTINFIVSGHRVADSTVLAYRKAATTGVRVRVIMQNNPTTTDVGLETYQAMGAQVKYLSNIGIRLFVFDGHTAVLTSYDDTTSSRAFGIRFTYPPVAQQLDQLFEQRWLQAQSLD